MRTIGVLLPLPFNKPFDYAMPEGMDISPGAYVRVPFGSRELYGVVWAEAAGDVTSKKIKSIAAVAEHIPPMPAIMREFIDWVADYTLAPRGNVLKMSMPVGDALHSPATDSYYTLSSEADNLATSAARKKILALLEDGFARPLPEIAEGSGVSSSTVRSFIQAGGLQAHAVERKAALPDYNLTLPPPVLSSQQQAAANELAYRLGSGFSVTLLDGVTGSGKTEVYFDTIAKLLADPPSLQPKSGKDSVPTHDYLLNQPPLPNPPPRGGRETSEPAVGSDSLFCEQRRYREAPSTPFAAKKAKELRKDKTEAEKRIWHLLRRKQLHGHRFRQQVPIGPYIVDFACLKSRLIIEIDGGQHCESEHDKKRDTFLESQNFRIIRFWNNEVFENPEGIYEVIEKALDPSEVGNPIKQMGSDSSPPCGGRLGGGGINESLISSPPSLTLPREGGGNIIESAEKFHTTRTSNLSPQILVLLPEIALSVQWMERFRKRFGDTPHIWHSSVPAARKRETWRAIANGEAKLVVGARSVLFLPFRNLQLIIVDEEHEHAFKQEEGVIYQGRDMAVVRAQKEKIPLMLVSATPALETIHNVQQGKYAEVKLPRRHGAAELPTVAKIDLRANKPPAQQWISTPLREAVQQTLEAGQQAMLFINRRGYAPLVLCRACGHRFGCPHCSAWLVEHQHPPRLQCHHCDFRTPPPTHCPECGEVAEEALVSCGPGAERLMAEAEKAFPEARIGLMTSDAIPTPQAAELLIERVMSGEINLLVGTQMMAKGYHFPGLSLVGVVDADLGLAGGDLRAAERSWQLLHQLAGRAGRAEHKGRVLLQTYLPDHPVMQALEKHDRDNFVRLEMQAREMAGMPPFGRLAALIIEGPNEPMVQEFSRKLVRLAPNYQEVHIFGPAPAPLAILRGKYRYRILVKTARKVNVPQLLRDWLTPHKPPAGIKLKVDVDPYSFM